MFTEADFNIHSGQPKSGPWLLEATDAVRDRWVQAARLRLPDVPSKALDTMGITQRKLNGNFMSWMDQLSDQDKHEGGLWYPTGNEWGHHASELHTVHPDKVFGVMSKTSPQRAWYDNLADTDNIVGNHRYSPHEIVKPGGISGRDNLRQALRVMDAPDDPDAIHQAFLGTKNVKRKGQPVAIPRNPSDLPKTYDFMRTLRDPEEGGAGNYLHQPGVVDSWMSRSMLWPKQAWDEAQAGGKPLSWPGQGTGEGLDKPLPVKKPNPDTGRWEVMGSRPPNARDVAARVVGMAGGYDRMRNAMRYGAARHDMPFTHGAQAAVWKSISGNENPSGVSSGEDPFYIEHPGQRWDEMWNRRASGLHVPVHQQTASMRTAAHGDPHEIEDTLDEGWGGPEDIRAIMRHISMAPPGWDHWLDRPGLVSVDVPSTGHSPARPPVQQRGDQRMGPDPRQASWYVDSAVWRDGPHTSEGDTGDEHRLKIRYPWEENPHFEWQHYHDPHDRPATGIANSLDEAKAQAEQSHKDLSGQWDPDSEQDALDPRLLGAARFARRYFATDDGLDEGLDPGEDKKKKKDLNTGLEAGGAIATPANINEGTMPDASSSGPLPIRQFVQPGGGMSGGSMPSSSGGGGGSSSGGGGGAPIGSGGGGHPDGGPPSQSLTQALQRAGIDPSMYPLLSGFSATEGNNPSGAPTLGFTDSQAGSTLDDHAQALAKQLQDRQSVAGPYPHTGTPEEQASWMATVVGQNGSPSDWQGNAQPARSDYVNRIVQNMPTAPVTPTGT